MQRTLDSPYNVQVIDRALAILGVLGDRQADFSLSEVCSTVKLHKSTVHRLLMVLERHRLVQKSVETGRYRLGLRLFELGCRAGTTLDLREHFRPYLSRILHETAETVHGCILDQGEVLYIEKMEPQQSNRMASTVGRRAPAYCTAEGKAILSELPDADFDLLVRRQTLSPITPNTITNLAALKAELKTIRARGYAIDDEENEEGIRGIGAVVRDGLGRPVAGISVSGPVFRITRAKVSMIASSVVCGARALSVELGYRPEPARTTPAGEA
jgi:IclR family KDG regulon transcriptional repressor